MNKIFLHIGYPKTATTTIQKSLFQSSDINHKDSEFYYPKFASNHGTALYSICSDNPYKYQTNIARGYDSKKKIDEHNSNLKHKIEDELSNLKSKKIIFSGEKLSSMTSSEIQKLNILMKPFGEIVKVIIYVRDPIGYATSWVQQAIKNNKNLSDFISKPPLPRYQKRITPWLDFFGSNKLEVVDFTKAIKSKNGLLKDFLSRLNGFNINIKEVRENESLCAESIYIVDQVSKKRPMINKGKANFGRVFQDTNNLFRGITGTKFELSKEILNNIKSNVMEDCIWLKDQFEIDFTKLQIKEQQKLKWDNETLLGLGLRLYDLYYENSILKNKIKKLNN